MAFEEDKIEYESGVESARQELETFVAKMVVECAVAKATGRHDDLARWGVDFIGEMKKNVMAMRGFFGAEIDLEQFHAVASKRAGAIDDGKDEDHLPIWLVDADGNKILVSVKDEIETTWAGLLGELAVLDVLEDLDLEMGEGMFLLRGEDSEMLKKFDLEGGADMVVVHWGEDEIVGFQTKLIRGNGVWVFDVSDEVQVAAMEAQVRTLKNARPHHLMHEDVLSDVSSETQRKSGKLAEVVANQFEIKNQLEKKYSSRLIYVLVGAGDIDKKTGLLREGVRERVKEDLRNAIGIRERRRK